MLGIPNFASLVAWAITTVLLAQFCLCDSPPAELYRSPLPRSAQISRYTGTPRWRVFPELFLSRTVEINCRNSQFQVFASQSDEELGVFYNNDAQSWCGLHRYLHIDAIFNSRVRTCLLTISPFSDTVVAVIPSDPIASFTSGSGSGQAKCTFQETSQLSVQLLVTGALGLLVFFISPQFAESVVFRISTGGLLSVLLFSIILSFYVLRKVTSAPHGGKVVTAATAMGAMGLGVADLTKFWFRFPDLPDLLYSKWLLAYVVISFLIGMAVTYYFDNEADTKLHTILKSALRLLGACMVAYSLQQLWEVAFLAVVVLFLALWLIPSRRNESSDSALSKTPTRTPRYTGDNYSPASTPDAMHAMHPSDHLRNTYMVPNRPGNSAPEPKRRSLLGRFFTRSPREIATSPRSLRSASPVSRPPAPIPNTWPHEARMALPNPINSYTGHTETGSEYHPSVAEPSSNSCKPATSCPSPQTTRTSPLLAEGVVKNVSSGRLIKIGGRVYQSLVDQGYELDSVQGLLSPPRVTPQSLSSLHVTSTSTQPPDRPSSRLRRAAAARPAGSTATSPI